MGSHCPTLRKSPSTQQLRRAFFGVYERKGVRSDANRRNGAGGASIVVSSERLFLPGWRQTNTTIGRWNGSAPGKRRKTASDGAKQGEKVDVSMRLLVCGFACCSDTCALGTKTPLLFRKSWGISRKSSGVFRVRCGARSKMRYGRRNKWERRGRICVSAATTCSPASR